MTHVMKKQRSMAIIEMEDFHDEGYLQELNRRFLHPLGMSMVVKQDERMDVSFAYILDCREEEEDGIIFGLKDLSKEGLSDMRKKANKVKKEELAKKKARLKKLGYKIQPL